MEVTYIGHATTLLDFNGFKVLTDPLLRSRVAHLQRRQKKLSEDIYKEVDLILISHSHQDHLDFPTLRRLKLKKDIPIIAPKNYSRYLTRLGYNTIYEMEVGEELTCFPIKIKAVKAEHVSIRSPKGTKDLALGYVLEGEKNVYFPGDTDLFPEMDELKEIGIDLALIPIGGWWYKLGPGHLNPMTAAQAVRMIGAKSVIPIHWGTFHPLGLKRIDMGFLKNPPVELAHWLHQEVPNTKLTVLKPGESTKF